MVYLAWKDLLVHGPRSWKQTGTKSEFSTTRGNKQGKFSDQLELRSEKGQRIIQHVFLEIRTKMAESKMYPSLFCPSNSLHDKIHRGHTDDIVLLSVIQSTDISSLVRSTSFSAGQIFPPVLHRGRQQHSSLLTTSIHGERNFKPLKKVWSSRDCRQLKVQYKIQKCL